MEIVLLVAGLAAGAVAAWLAARPRLARLETELEHERRAAATEAQRQELLQSALRTVSADALRELQRDARDDLEQRQQAIQRMVAPLKESLDKVDTEVRELEKSRGEAYGDLRSQLGSLAETQERLRAETSSLVTALRAPAVRGRWGEIQLRRVVEAAGMLPYCDFTEQVVAGADDRLLRPDLVVRLPGSKHVIVDAKTPLAAYLEALDAADEETQRARLRDHARQVREHVGKLSQKAYWAQFESAPDFVVLFIPGDPFFAAALDQDPSLQEDAWRQRIILATPSTLIGLLFIVAYGWRQEKVAESARAVSALGSELHERLRTLAGHFIKLGRSLDTAVGAYNDATGSLERRVLVTARRFSELGVPTIQELPEPEPIERATRVLEAPELTEGGRSIDLGPRERDAA
ncbi:MAG: DNA recombination protein RmuC [Thermoleophilia bacterium]|nr:DNA recombination protein RmuC [Thermoleophilia bacterium]